MKNLNIVLVIALIISISLIAIVMAIEENTYDLDYYMDSFEENDVYQVTGKTDKELETVSKDIITYLKGNDEDALNKHFKEREIHHMRDVLHLYEIARVIKLVSAIIALAVVLWFLAREKAGFMGKWMTLGLFANYLLLLILVVLVLTDFTRYFTVFHEIFFNNDLWILDPKTDLLIQMLPEPFFVNIAGKIGISFIKYLLVAQLIGYIFYKKGKYAIGRFKSNKRY
ncbi:MAG: TIGR01906 family membrane protein [Bacillota bacterium]